MEKHVKYWIESAEHDFDVVESLNISARYPDEKLKFYKLCTKEFTSHNLTRIKDIRKWLLKRIHS